MVGVLNGSVAIGRRDGSLVKVTESLQATIPRVV